MQTMAVTQVKTIANKVTRKAELPLRQWEGRRLVRRAHLARRIPDDTAYLPVDGAGLPAYDAIRQLALERHAERAAEGPLELPGRKDYLFPLFTEEDYRRHPEIFELGLDPNLLAIVTDYIGSLPLLVVAQVYWTPTKEYDPEGSQLYHSDSHDVPGRQLKLFVNMVDVTPEEGPFTFLPADLSEKVMASATREGLRYSDEDVRAHASRDQEISLTGPAGTGMLVDTNRCLHFGGRTHGRDRLLLIAQYGRVDKPGKPGQHIEPRRVGPKLADRVRNQVLRRRFWPPG
jgi:hypothetical protein